MTVVINLLGGPCCGKSTTAARIFSDLKLDANESVELVTEVVKDYVYDDNDQCLNDQVLMTAEQNHKIRRLNDVIDVVVTDASLLNGITYGHYYNIDDFDIVNQMVQTLYNNYNNLVFVLPRKPKYDKYGRSQSEAQAKVIDAKMIETLTTLNIPFYDMRDFTHREIPQKIIDILVSEKVISLK